MNKKRNILEMLRNIGSVILISGAILGFAWGTLIAPKIDKRIDTKIDPIKDLLLKQNFKIQQLLTEEQSKEAECEYKAFKEDFGGLNE